MNLTQFNAMKNSFIDTVAAAANVNSSQVNITNVVASTNSSGARRMLLSLPMKFQKTVHIDKIEHEFNELEQKGLANEKRDFIITFMVFNAEFFNVRFFHHLISTLPSHEHFQKRANTNSHHSHHDSSKSFVVSSITWDAAHTLNVYPT